MPSTNRSRSRSARSGSGSIATISQLAEFDTRTGTRRDFDGQIAARLRLAEQHFPSRDLRRRDAGRQYPRDIRCCPDSSFALQEAQRPARQL